MTNLWNKYDILVVKFPFVGSKTYKARPAVVISSDFYHANNRGTIIVLAISSQIATKLPFEIEISYWKEAGLLKPSIFKSNIITISNDQVIRKLGRLHEHDIKNLNLLLDRIL